MLGSKISPENRWTDIDILQMTEISIIMSVNSCGIKDYEGWVPQSNVLCDLVLDHPLGLQSCTKILNLKLFSRATMCKLCALRITQWEGYDLKLYSVWWTYLLKLNLTSKRWNAIIGDQAWALLYFFNRMRFIFLLTQYYLPHSAASYQSHRW